MTLDDYYTTFQTTSNKTIRKKNKRKKNCVIIMSDLNIYEIKT